MGMAGREANGEFLVQIGKSAFPKVVEGARHAVVKLILFPERIILFPLRCRPALGGGGRSRSLKMTNSKFSQKGISRA